MIAEDQASQEDDEIDDAVDDDVTDHFDQPLRQNAKQNEQFVRAEIQLTDDQAGHVARLQVLVHDVSRSPRHNRLAGEKTNRK